MDYRGRRPLEPGQRLGCAAHILDDVVIDVPAASQVHRQVVRKRAGVDALPVDPVIRLHYVEVDEPDLSSPTGDRERLAAALFEQWQLADLEFDPDVMVELQKALRKGEWKVTVAVRHGRQVIAIWPGFRDLMLGVAFDVGSTTIAGHLCDLTTGSVLASAGRMNPQIGFGEDLMSRVSYVMMNEGGEARLTAVVREAINGLIGDLVAEAGRRPGRRARADRRRQPDHASSGAGLRPPRVGHGAVRPRHRLGPRHPGGPARISRSIRGRWSTRFR